MLTVTTTMKILVVLALICLAFLIGVGTALLNMNKVVDLVSKLKLGQSLWSLLSSNEVPEFVTAIDTLAGNMLAPLSSHLLTPEVYKGTFPSPATNFYSLHTKTLLGEEFDFATLKNQVILITNVACACGKTLENYQDLVMLDFSYQNRVAIVGFPSNDFYQEQGNSSEIIEFTRSLGVHFPLMEMAHVNGKNIHPVLAALKQVTRSEDKDILWNFETKFLISKDGNRVERYSKTFGARSLRPEIERLLQE